MEMSPEIISALIGLVGIIIGVIPTYLFVQKKNSAEVVKLQAEADKTRAEAEKIRAELAELQSHKTFDNNTPVEIFIFKALQLLITEDLTLSSSLSEIILRQMNRLNGAVEQFIKQQDWDSLISLKEILREVFEYTGEYSIGVKFGRAFVLAYEAASQKIEAIWASVKNVGYLLILSGNHKDGRKELNNSINKLSFFPQNSPSVIECLFYAHRYMGISYQRDLYTGNFQEAILHFDECYKYLNKIDDPEKHDELYARYLGNQGNIATDEKNYTDAIKSYKESLKLFTEIGDKEHIGIANLQIAETLILDKGAALNEKPDSYLVRANMLFNEIGWVEGQARVFKQYAKIYKEKAYQTNNLDDKKEFESTSLDYAEQSLALYKQINVKKQIGRMEEFISELKKI
jgi:tetratricopeptide (TPR) repeat protein